MKRFRAAFILAVAAIVAPSSEAIPSRSASFTNARSALSSGGRRSSGASFRLDSASGLIAVTTQSASGFGAQAGLLPGYFFPARLADLSASSCVPGEIVLGWTAPGNDGAEAGSSAKRYVVRVSTEPTLSPAASRALFAAAASPSGAPPTPGVSGSAQSFTLAGLAAGSTFYIAAVALEADGTAGPLSPGATAYVSATGASLAEFDAATGFKVSVLQWKPLGAASPECGASAFRVYRSTDPIGAFAPVLDTGTTAYTDAGVLVGATYYYRVGAINAASVEFTASPVRPVYVRTAPTLPPLRVRAEAAGGSVRISWDAPTAYDFGLSFADPSLPQPDELSGYDVWRATNPVTGPWSLVATPPLGDRDWVDAAPPPLAVYRVTAVNLTEESRAALMLTAGGFGLAITPDGAARLELPPEDVESLAGETAYWIEAASVPVSAGASALEAGRPQSVVRAARFQVRSAAGVPDRPFAFPKPATVLLSAAASAGALHHEPDQTSVYWNNGAKWLKLYGRLDGGSLAAPTSHDGQFQLRSLERTQAFNFDPSGLSNRFVTPNGDGLNDRVVFIFDNPRDSRIAGRVFDLRGARVADLTQTAQNTSEWDAKSGGLPVPGGVYVYQLEGDGKVFNGTIVVIR